MRPLASVGSDRNVKAKAVLTFPFCWRLSRSLSMPSSCQAYALTCVATMFLRVIRALGEGGGGGGGGGLGLGWRGRACRSRECGEQLNEPPPRYIEIHDSILI